MSAARDVLEPRPPIRVRTLRSLISLSISDFDLTVVLSAHVGPLGPAPVKRPPPPPLAPPNLHEQCVADRRRHALISFDRILQKLGDHGDVDIHFLSASLWQQMLDDNNVHALTCECLAPPFALCRPKIANKRTISFMRLKHQVYRYVYLPYLHVLMRCAT